MPQFFESMMGRRFFEAEVPRAIHTLEKIGRAIERLASAAEAETAPRPPSKSDRELMQIALDALANDDWEHEDVDVLGVHSVEENAAWVNVRLRVARPRSEEER